MADISAEITAFQNAVYGEDVRSAMISLANKLNEVVIENTNIVDSISDITSINISIGEERHAYINGVYYPTDGYFVTNSVSISPGVRIIYTSDMFTDGLSNVFLDKTGNVLAYYTRTSQEATYIGNNIYRFELIASENAVAFIGSCKNGYISTILMHVFADENFYSYINGIYPKVNDIYPKVNELYTYTNLLDPAHLIERKYILNTGVEATSNTWSATDYILLKPNTTYYVGNFYGKENYAFYDVTYTPVSSKTFGDIQITVTSEDARYSYGNFTTGNDILYIRLSEPTEWIDNDMYLSEYNFYSDPGLDVSPNAKNHETRIRDLEINIDSNPLYNKKILVIGDSISTDTYHTIGVPAWDKWATMLSKKYHFALTNDSVHATGWVADTSTQDRSKTFPKRIIQHTASESYDLIVVFGGVNDFIQGCPFGTASDTDWDSYILASMKYCFDYLINTFTEAQIVGILPLQYKGKNLIKNGLTLEGYVENMKEVYDDYSIATLDLFHEGGFRAWNNTFNERFGMLAGSDDPAQQVHDGLHPNQDWDNNYLAPQMYRFLINQFL